MKSVYSLFAVIILLLICASAVASVPAPLMEKGRPEENVDQLAPGFTYVLAEVHAVDGRQGVAWSEGSGCVSGSTALSRFGEDWEFISGNADPFSDFDVPVNHIGDIDCFDGEIYAGVEYFMDGEASNIRIAVYDADTLALTRFWPFEASSGQTEVSGIAVDPDHGSVWMCSWADGESGRYLYRYDLSTGEYLGRFHLQPAPQWIQGIAYCDGWIYLTADDGTADLGEPDHIYRCRVDTSASAFTVTLERTLDDVALPGEIEGLSFDRVNGRLLVCYNRGAQIVLGMPLDLYEGYDGEIHEIYVYDRIPNAAASSVDQ